MARHPKELSREQLQARKEKAVRFTRDVLSDPERAAEIDSESADEYAQRKRIKLLNPARRFDMQSPRKQIRDLKKQIQELEDENDALQEKLDNIADVIQTDEEENDDNSQD